MTNLQAQTQATNEITNNVFFAEIGQRSLAASIIEDIQVSVTMGFNEINISLISEDGIDWFETNNIDWAIEALAHALVH